jgi:SAM-dependent methyltransferase
MAIPTITAHAQNDQKSAQSKAGLPARYHTQWRPMLLEHLPDLPENATILDFGSGRKPAISQEHRPATCTYIGLDPSFEELNLAGLGAYDEQWVSTVETLIPELLDRVDLAVSWQVLEHVHDFQLSLSNVGSYLKPGGMLLSMVSSRNACFAVLNRIIPEKLGVLAMERLLNRPPDTVFRANYDRCTYDQIIDSLNHWTSVEVIPFYRAAEYFGFSRIAQKAYLAYENRAMKAGKRNLATHYLIKAVK